MREKTTDIGGQARDALEDGVESRDRLAREVNRLLAERGVRFGDGEGGAFRGDPVPRLVDRDEWAHLAAGLAQRVRALELFLDDVYGERTVVTDGVVPARVVEGSGFFERDLVGVVKAGGARVSVAGLDVVRDRHGRLRVLEDNVRNPSGLAYAMAVSDAVAEVLGVDDPPSAVGAALPGALRRCLEASAPDVDGELVLLTEGAQNSAYYEHQRLAEVAGLLLVELGDLVRRGDRVHLRDGRRVRSVYRRTGQDRLREEGGRLTPEAALLLDPLRAGEVGVANWFGTGVADDKVVYGYVDALVRYFLGEEPLVPSVPTYDLLDEAQREAALDRVADLVVKPRDGHGGHGVVIGPTASDAELDVARHRLRHEPEGWVAQEVVSLSTHPTVVDGELVERHVDLRPFVFHDGRHVVVPPGGLTRVAMTEGDMVVNSSQEGGGKATWVR